MTVRRCWTLRSICLVAFVMAVAIGLPVVRSLTVQPIEEVLDAEQGYNTKLNDPTPFGYVFRIDSPYRRFGPDQPIHQYPEQTNQAFPSYAMMVLTNVTYVASDAPIFLEGRVSSDTGRRLHKQPLTSAPVTFQFSTYAFDPLLNTWFQRFQSGDESLQGRVTNIHVHHHKKPQPLVQMQIEPIPGLVQTLKLANNAGSHPIQVSWGPPRSSAKEAAFHQIVMGDVLF
ncbi:hypothetical protein BJV82DRAFT_149229 [Fennellomyces sp. T-0311]|nr:hypothetical protein BJV82DRAFT_149229 [Fennellomyces sp. T-0311]